MHALIVNNSVARYPYTFADLQADNPQVTFASQLSTEEAASYGMHVVVAKGQPEHSETETVVEVYPTYNEQENQWEQSFEVRPAL